jgi:hypothetical protein
MDDRVYVPFEPGIGLKRVWTPKVAVAKGMDRVPDASAVGTSEADAWFESPAIANLNSLYTRKPAAVATRAAVFHDAKHLFVAVECIECEMSRTRRLVPKDAAKGEVEVVPGVMPRSLTHDDHVRLFLDPRHDKTTYYDLTLSITGAARAHRSSAPMGWTALPAMDYLELDGLRWEHAVAERADRWRAAFRVDLTSIAVDPVRQPTVGFNVVRGRNVDVLRHDSWADVVHPDAVPGLALGDLYLGERGAAVRTIDWGTIEYGANRVTLTVAGAKGREVELKVTVTDTEGKYSAATRSGAVKLPAGGTAQVRAAFDIPFHLVGVLATLELSDRAGGELLYRATFPMRSHGDLRIAQPYASAVPTRRDDPSPNDSHFHEKKVRFIVSRLPKFCRRTTAQGALSDFTLMSEDGRIVFDLMKPGALKRIADWVSTLFTSDNDRLAAVALLTNDDWVTVHAAPRAGMQDQLTPLSMLRLGGGHCYSRAVIGAGIVRELVDPATGENHEAYPVLVLGHVVTAVRRQGDWTLIDPTFGHFFHNRDNTDLATATELEADPSLVARVVTGAARLANYAKTAGQVRIETGAVVWPAGAPPA